MKKTLLFSLVITISFLWAGCSGYLYTSAPPLEFSAIDYGYPVNMMPGNPSIAYIDAGKGEHTIILVHGLASNAGFWRYNIGGLAKHFRVIAVDLPGYGKSQKDSYPYNMSFYAEQVKRLADHLNLDKFILAGHSMGGQTAITFALKHPERLEKLILASPAGFEKFQTGEGDWLRSVMTVEGVKKTTEDGIRRNLAANFYTWNDKREWMVEERVRMSKAEEFDEFAYAVVRSVNGMLDEPTFNKVGSITVPTLIIYGENDGLIPNPYLNPGFTKDVMQKGHTQIKNSELVEIPGTGHMLQIEKPEIFNNAVIEFVTK
ncbi:MAG: alpha/beta fold hydrolase [Ignavibacteriaceae bacterium]